MSATSVYKQLLDSAAQYADRPFLHIPGIALSNAGSSPAADFDASYAETLSETNRLLSQYRNSGLLVGSRVAILLENKPEFFFHWFALNALGVSVVPVNAGLTEAEVSYLLEHSDVCAAVSLADKISLLETSAESAGLSIPIVADTDIASLRLNGLASSTDSEIGLETECAILYTSGSTGKPKGCLLSNDYFLACGAWYRDAEDYCKLEKGSERLITPLPLVHMNAMACSTMGMLMTGGCVIQLDRFHPSSWWQTVRDSRATVIHYLGVMPAILLSMTAEQSDSFAGQIKFAFGAGVNPVHHAAFETRFGFPLIESWGMTETGSSNSVTAIREPRHVGTSCIGKRPDRLEIKLVDAQGNETANGEPGELLVRVQGKDPRQGFFSGYYKNQEATDEAWRGGWFHTGDILRQGEDGSYHFVDRLKNVIRRSGENISALEVEASLSLDQDVDYVGVTAVPDEMRGDEVIAMVIPHKGVATTQSTAEQIFVRAANTLSYFKLPGYVAFMEVLPLTASNKPQRAELKKQARELVANIENNDSCFDLRHMKKGSKKKT